MINFARLFSYTILLEKEINRWIETGLKLKEQHDEELANMEIVHRSELDESAKWFVKERDREIKALNERMNVMRHDYARERTAFYEEIRSLRENNVLLLENNVKLLERVEVKLQMIPHSEPLKSEPLTEEQLADRSKRIDSVRRTGPVATSRQRAEADYEAAIDKAEQLRSKGEPILTPRTADLSD